MRQRKRLPIWSNRFFRAPPHKPRHTDEPMRARARRNKGIERTPTRRLSFRRFWRENAGNVGLAGHPRRWRRAQVRGWYQEQKRTTSP